MNQSIDFLKQHLTYEACMLRGTYQELNNNLHNEIVKNALIESFCIHARQLIEFFSNKQGMHAKDFTGGTYTPKHIVQLSAVANKLNTQIAHLTKKRTESTVEKIGHLDRSRLLTALELEMHHFANLLEKQFQGHFTAPAPLQSITISGAASATNHILSSG